MKTGSFLCAAALALFTSFILHPSSLFAQGSLTPPGPPAPTMKTLDQVEPRKPISSLPFTISAPGSYYLTQNLSLTSSTLESGITVAANNVSIDLQGFTLSGHGNTASGIAVPNSQTNLIVRDGALLGWGYRGVDGEVWAVNCQLLRLRASDNGDAGLSPGKAGTVMQCSCANNGYIGILAGEGCVVQGCSTTYNANSGISASYGSTVSDCTSVNNLGGIGIFGGTIRGCSAEGSEEDGIVAYEAVVLDCNVQRNMGRGIVVSEGSSVNRCTSILNSRHGIQVDSHCRITDNVCQLNGFNDVGAGILVLGNENRIDGNHVIRNDYGIQVTATNNIIIRNSAQGNGTNYLFIGAQVFGPTNNLVGAGGVITNQNPWANFSF